MNEGVINGLLAGWAVRDARRRLELAEQPDRALPEHAGQLERVLKARFTEQFVGFLLGRGQAAEQPWDGEPEQIALRYLLSENRRLLGELEFHHGGRLAGTYVRDKNAALERSRIRLVAKRLREKHSNLRHAALSTLIAEIRRAPEFASKKPGAGKIRRALSCLTCLDRELPDFSSIA